MSCTVTSNANEWCAESTSLFCCIPTCVHMSNFTAVSTGQLNRRETRELSPAAVVGLTLCLLEVCDVIQSRHCFSVDTCSRVACNAVGTEGQLDVGIAIFSQQFGPPRLGVTMGAKVSRGTFALTCFRRLTLAVLSWCTNSEAQASIARIICSSLAGWRT